MPLFWRLSGKTTKVTSGPQLVTRLARGYLEGRFDPANRTGPVAPPAERREDRPLAIARRTAALDGPQ